MNQRTKLFVPVAAFLVLAGLLLFALSRDPNDVPSALLDKPMPEFTQPALFPDRGQTEFTKADLLGDIVILNVWGSWCPPCHAEHPFLMDISEQESDITFVGVSYDYSIEEDRAFLEEKGNPFDLSVVDLDGSLRIDLGVTGAPETFLINAEGVIVHRHIGEINYRVWERDFVPVLAELRQDTGQAPK